jgi:DNA-binding MarR family transcriptional regulator
MAAERPDAAAIAGAVVGFARALNARLRETPEGTGLTFAELNVLAGIEKGYDLTSTLARRLVLDPPRVSRIVEAFAEGGYVTREPDSGDRRRTRLRLTPSGTEYLSRGRAELSTAMEDLLGDMTDEERDSLERAVSGMRRVRIERAGARSEPVEDSVSD